MLPPSSPWGWRKYGPHYTESQLRRPWHETSPPWELQNSRSWFDGTDWSSTGI